MKTLNDVSHAIQQGRTQTALNTLTEIVQDRLSDQQELRNSTIALSARFNKLQRQRQAGLLGDGEAQITHNQIVYAALELIEILREELNGREPGISIQKDEAARKTRILFFAANPLGKGQLNLDKEIRQIEASLARAKLRDRFEFKTAMATRPDDFLNRILEFKPEIVHFSGHGAPDGLYMMNDLDDTVLIPAPAIAKVFQLFREVVGCVVLNACYSATQADRIREYIPAVIGTTQKVGDDAAIQFATLFYTAIGEGHDIDFAFEYARLGLGLKEMDEDVFAIK